MVPREPQHVLLYYASGVMVTVILFLLWRPRAVTRMRLKLEKTGHPPRLPDAPGLTHIPARGERPLNVVFNYNGHSWDAYEVLGLPAGSPPEKVEEFYHSQAATVDAESRPFLEAAYHAIQSQWREFHAAASRSN